MLAGRSLALESLRGAEQHILVRAGLFRVLEDAHDACGACGAGCGCVAAAADAAVLLTSVKINVCAKAASSDGLGSAVALDVSLFASTREELLLEAARAT